MIPETSEIIFVRHKRNSSRREKRVVLVAVLIGLVTAVILAMLLILEASKHAN